MNNTTVFKMDITNTLLALQMSDDSTANALGEAGALTPELERRLAARREARAEVAQALGVTLTDDDPFLIVVHNE